jgi:RNA polymerase-binding protein DksA
MSGESATTGTTIQRRRIYAAWKNGEVNMLKRPSAAVAKARLDDLRTILQSRRAELAHDVQGRIRDVRSDGIGDRDVLDAAESSEVDIQDDIEFALIQLKAETLKKMDTALRYIEEGDYGGCFECGGEIPEARLRAVPFAVRCRDCEAIREATDQRERSMAHRGSSALFVDLTG